MRQAPGGLAASHTGDLAVTRKPAGPLSVPAKCLAVTRVTLASRLAYLGDLLLRNIFLLLILFTFTQLWEATGKGRSLVELTGFSISQLIWYLAFTESIIMSGPSLFENEVDREVRTGDLAYRLARPLPYPLFHLGSQIGERLLRFVLTLAAGCLISLLVVGPISLSPLAVPAALFVTLLAILADWIWSFSISLLSFWVEDTLGLHLLYRRALMILGGMLIPLEAYPEWLARIAGALPFQYLVYRPARLFVQPDASGLLQTAGVLLLLMVIGLIPLAGLYHLGLRRVAAQGG